MEYLVNGNRYSYSYEELKQKFEEIKDYTDEQFISQLPDILHYACFVCWLTGIPSNACLSDEGIIHQLVHLLAIPNEPMIDLQNIRKQFNLTLHPLK